MDKVIAIDGPSASGKSTLARALAEKLHIPYVNTGSMFRAVAFAASQRHIDWDNAAALGNMAATLKLEYKLNAEGRFELACDGEFPGRALRNAEIASGASRVATLPAVREALKQRQQAMSAGGWLVMEGRDIGTVIFPQAMFKFFITASPLERARRRLAQEGDAAGESLAAVAQAIARRDELDSHRAIAPLVPAPDAEIIDNSDMTPEFMLNLIYNKVKNAVL